MTILMLSVLLLACGDKDGDDTGPGGDGGSMDGGSMDGGADGGTDGGADGGTDGGSDGGTDGGSDGGTDGGADGGTDGGADGGAECTATLVSLEPGDGTADVDPDPTIQAVLSEEDLTADLVLTDSDGVEVPFDGDSDGTTITVVPDTLDWGATYTATVDWCEGAETASTSFTVVEDTLGWDPTGVVWLVDLAEAETVEPAGVGSLITGSIEHQLAVQVLDYGATLDLRLAWTDEAGRFQDTCQLTQEPGSAPTPDLPEVDVLVDDLIMPFAGVAVPMGETTMTATVGKPGAPLAEVELSGTADLRKWDAFFAEIGTEGPEEFCDLLVSFGVECQDCGDGDLLCLDYTFGGIEGIPRPVAIDEVTEEMIAHDPTCD